MALETGPKMFLLLCDICHLLYFHNCFKVKDLYYTKRRKKFNYIIVLFSRAAKLSVVSAMPPPHAFPNFGFFSG